MNLKERIQVQIPDEVVDKIKFVNNRHSKIEWAGALIYEVENESLPIYQWKIKVLDILPMSVGTTGAVIIPNMEDALFWAADNYPDKRVGCLHSHHEMGSFFSGDDMADLNHCAKEYAVYLSLVVNNRGQYVAKISKSIDVTSTVEYNIDDEKFSFNVTANKDILVIECDVITNNSVLADTNWIKLVDSMVSTAKPVIIPANSPHYPPRQPELFDRNRQLGNLVSEDLFSRLMIEHLLDGQKDMSWSDAIKNYIHNDHYVDASLEQFIEACDQENGIVEELPQDYIKKAISLLEGSSLKQIKSFTKFLKDEFAEYAVQPSYLGWDSE